MSDEVKLPEYVQSEEIMGRAFAVMPDLTEAQKQLLLTCGARLYIRGCGNMAKSVLAVAAFRPDEKQRLSAAHPSARIPLVAGASGVRFHGWVCRADNEGGGCVPVLHRPGERLRARR